MQRDGASKKRSFKVSYRDVLDKLSHLKNINVLVIGDVIIDQYVFAKQKGRAIKDPILSTEYVNHETYAGGIYATANHMSSFVKSIKLVTVLGDTKSKESFLRKSVAGNITVKHFFKPDSVTTVKKRFVDAYRGNKLFKVEYINDQPLPSNLSRDIVSYLEDEIPKYDLVIVNDFGHGFINEDIRKIIQDRSRYLAINVQSNSANMGFNYINLYKKAHFATMNESEVRLPVMMRFEDLPSVMGEFSRSYSFDKFIVTIGKNGSLLYNKGSITECPIVIDSVVDTVGSGDALFALSSLFSFVGSSDELIAFAGNVAGGIKTNYIGNKESVSKEKFIEVVRDVLK